MFGPMMIAVVVDSGSGKTKLSSLIRYFSGFDTLGQSPSFLGSVIFPKIAAATAVSGEQRYT